MTDPATAYAESVVAGEIVTGALVRMACDRHLKDIDEQEKRGLLWDAEEAERLCQFAELHHHFKGRWAKESCTCGSESDEPCPRRIVLQPWQAFCGGLLVGWKRQNDAGRLVRRFYTGYIQVSRKTGKTHFGAIIANYLTFFDLEPGAEGYIAAAAGHQARYVHDICKSIVRASPALKSRIGGWHQKLSNLYGETEATADCRIVPVSSESENLDSLSPHLILLDELHAHKDSGVRDVLDTGTGGRDQPLMLEITTAGEERSDSICKAERDYGEQVLRGDLADDSFFAYIAELDKGDDWQDPSVYIKAIPSLGVTIRQEDLERKIAQAASNALIRDSHKIKIANMWLSVFSGMFDAEQWRACDGKIDRKSLRGRACFAGIDLAQKIDMSSLALLFPPEDDEFWRCLVYYWVPAQTLARKAIRDKPLLQWQREGLIEIAGDARMDNDFIAKRIEALSQRYTIQEIGFDPWKATQLADTLEKAGHMMIQVRQGHQTLGSATDELVAVVADGRLIYDDNPVLRWNAKNSVAREDQNGNRIPSKKRSRGNIDGISATIIAMSRALAGGPSQSIYNPGATPSGRSVYRA